MNLENSGVTAQEVKVQEQKVTCLERAINNSQRLASEANNQKDQREYRKP